MQEQVEIQNFAVKYMQKQLRISISIVRLYFIFMVLAVDIVIVAIIIERHFVNQRTDYKYQKLQNC